MKRASKIVFILAILASVLSSQASLAAPEKRLALVIGNASYKAQPLVTAVNDAALVSQTLQMAGFEVTGARDLDQTLLRDAVRNFTDKVTNAGAGTVIFVYFAGYGVQLAGDNYLIPVGVEISNVTDIPARALSLSELMHGLSALDPKSTFIVLDAGRPGPFIMTREAGGLAWTEPDAKMLIAFSTAPGTTARDTAANYGAYARAIAEMVGEGGLTPASLFDRVRLRVHELTGGGQVPWEASRIEAQFKFVERSPGTGRSDAEALTARFRLQPMRAIGAQNAYMTALLRDTFDGYADFLADYWQDPMTKRVRALLAARRESITWQRTCQANEPVAYWSYLERYPNGPHAADAARLLTRLGAATTPPSRFARIDFDVAPPLPDELEFVERPVLILDDPSLRLEPPPPTPASFLEPLPQESLNLKPPAASQGHTLPVLDLPLVASSRLAPPEARVPSTPSSDRDEARAVKPAIGIPYGMQKQADSSWVPPLLPTDGATDRAKGTPAASGRAMQGNIAGAQTRNQTIAKADSDRSDGNEETSALQLTQRTAQAMPAWLIDVMTARTSRVSLGGDLSLSAPSMFASASAGLTFQTWQYGIPRMRSSLPSTRPASPAASRARLPAQSSAGPISPSHATGGILRSTPRSATLTPIEGGTPPSIAGAPMKPRKQPSTIKPAPPNQVVRESREAAPPDQ